MTTGPVKRCFCYLFIFTGDESFVEAFMNPSIYYVSSIVLKIVFTIVFSVKMFPRRLFFNENQKF